MDSHIEKLSNSEDSEEKNKTLVNQKDLGQIPGGQGLAVGIRPTSFMDSQRQDIRTWKIIVC